MLFEPGNMVNLVSKILILWCEADLRLRMRETARKIVADEFNSDYLQ